MLITILYLNNKSETLLFNLRTKMGWRVGLIADGPEEKVKVLWDQAIRKCIFHNNSSSRVIMVLWINKSSKQTVNLLVIQGLQIIKWVITQSQIQDKLMQAQSCQLRKKWHPKLLLCPQIIHSIGPNLSKRRKLFIVTAMILTSNLNTLKVGKVRHSRTCPKFLRYYRTPRLKRKIRNTKRL